MQMVSTETKLIKGEIKHKDQRFKSAVKFIFKIIERLFSSYSNKHVIITNTLYICLH